MENRIATTPQGDKKPSNFAQATLQLGTDFISPFEVANVYGFQYSDEQLATFADTLPDEETLQLAHTNGEMLVPAPPTDCNLLQVRELDTKVFSCQTGGWFSEKRQVFSRKDVVRAGQWLLVRKKSHPDSGRKSWLNQQKLLSNHEYVPNAPELVYAITAYFKVRGIRLLKDGYVRTASVNVAGDHVIVGNFLKTGLNVRAYHDKARSDSFGISFARKILAA